MYKKMLVLLDGSKLAEVVFSYARELSGRLSLNLELLNVCPPAEESQIPMRQAYLEHMAETLGSQSEALRLATAERGVGEKIQTRASVIVGNPVEEILKYAGENRVDVILLSSHGRSGLTNLGLGSVAQRVIHASKIPTWLVPAGIKDEVIFDRYSQRTLLVPLDGSTLAEAVIPHVAELTRQRGAETDVLLLNVCDPDIISESQYSLIPSGSIAGLPATWTEYAARERAKCQRVSESYLAAVKERMAGLGLNARALTLVGAPAEEIVHYVQANALQLIVMATHGRSGLSRIAFGSVTEKVLSEIRTPVFLIRPR